MVVEGNQNTHLFAVVSERASGGAARAQAGRVVHVDVHHVDRAHAERARQRHYLLARVRELICGRVRGCWPFNACMQSRQI